MKRNLLFLAVALAVLNTSNIWAANIVTINDTAGPAFGSFVAASGGTVSVSALGVRTNTGGVILVTSAFSAASFTVTRVQGNPNMTYTITLPANGTVTITCTSPGTCGANSMAVNNFVSNPTPTGQLTSGTQILTVGATLTVGANQATGTYSGTYNVTVVGQ